MIEKVIEVERMEHVISVFGSFDQNLRLIEEELEVKVIDRDNRIHICGEPEAVMHAEKAINGLLTLAAKGENTIFSAENTKKNRNSAFISNFIAIFTASFKKDFYSNTICH